MERQLHRTPRAGGRRDDFDQKTAVNVAKRSAFQCAVCSAVTVGAGTASPNAVINIGVAAHIAAASPGGPRYNPLMTPKQRSHISNAIWLCQNHAKWVDDDVVEWPTAKLHEIKHNHERSMRLKIGIPARPSSSRPRPKRGGKPTVREYAFVDVRSLIPAYKAMLAPMLHDQKLGEESELGILMIDAPVVGSRNAGVLLPWTVFVKPIWLRWVVQGHGAGFGLQSEVPPDQIYGQIPVWPDEFFEFLGAIVESGKKFEWQRSPKGYLALQQSQSHA